MFGIIFLQETIVLLYKDPSDIVFSFATKPLNDMAIEEYVRMREWIVESGAL
jgi:hypothetical protein